MAALLDRDSLVVVNKGDLLDNDLKAPDGAETGLPAALSTLGLVPYLVSARTGEGLTRLLGALGEAVEARLGGGGDALITRARHREAFAACREALSRAQGAEKLELVAEDLRLAVRALGRVTGRVDVEDLLDVIFRDFCIGK